MFDSIKAWFKYSESILLARLTAVVGLVTAAVGAMDWAPLTSLDLSTGFSKTQVIYLGSIAFIQGVIAEVLRRRNDPYMTVQTAVAAEPEVVKAKKEVQKTVDQTPVFK